jgi:hypothetical protein
MNNGYYGGHGNGYNGGYGGQRRNFNYGYRNNNYGGGYPQQAWGGYPPPPKKRSGAKVTLGARGTKGEGFEYVTAWNVSKDRGLITAFVFPYKNTHEYKNSRGEVSETLMCKIEYKRTGQTKLVPCTRKISSGKVRIPELGMVINPKAPNGGYFGRFTKKR